VSSRHGDGGNIRHAEEELLLTSNQGQEERDGDPVHLLRHPRGERGAPGGEADGAATGGSRIVGRLKRF